MRNYSEGKCFTLYAARSCGGTSTLNGVCLNTVSIRMTKGQAIHNTPHGSSHIGVSKHIHILMRICIINQQQFSVLTCCSMEVHDASLWLLAAVPLRGALYRANFVLPSATPFGPRHRLSLIPTDRRRRGFRFNLDPLTSLSESAMLVMDLWLLRLLVELRSGLLLNSSEMLCRSRVEWLRMPPDAVLRPGPCSGGCRSIRCRCPRRIGGSSWELSSDSEFLLRCRWSCCPPPEIGKDVHKHARVCLLETT